MILILAPAAPAAAETRFGGPDNVENQLRSDREVDRSLLERWEAWKLSLQEKRGLSFSIDYSAVYLGADDSPGEDDTAGGMVRFFGAWDLTGRGTKNTGALVWKIEHRHDYTDVAPSDFGFNLGYVGLLEPPFSNHEFRLQHRIQHHRRTERRTGCGRGGDGHRQGLPHRRTGGRKLRSAGPPGRLRDVLRRP